MGVTHHRAGWSPDSPRPRSRSSEDAAARPTGPRPSYGPPEGACRAREMTCGRSPRPLSGRAAPAAQNGGMLILLPPSETKTRPSEVGAETLDLAVMSLPCLRDAREEMLRAAQHTAAGPDAGKRLGVPASAPELVGRMLHLAQEPVAAPLEVYSGVLFDQLEKGVSPAQDRQVLVRGRPVRPGRRHTRPDPRLPPLRELLARAAGEGGLLVGAPAATARRETARRTRRRPFPGRHRLPFGGLPLDDADAQR